MQKAFREEKVGQENGKDFIKERKFLIKEMWKKNGNNGNRIVSNEENTDGKGGDLMLGK